MTNLSSLPPSRLALRRNVLRFATSELVRRPIPALIAFVAAWAAGTTLWLVADLGVALYRREAARVEATLPAEVILVPPPGSGGELRIDLERLAQLASLPGVALAYPLVETQVTVSAGGAASRVVPTRGRDVGDPAHGAARLAAGRGFRARRAREVVVAADLFERLGGHWTEAGPEPRALEVRAARRLAGGMQEVALELAIVGLVRDAREADLIELPIGLAIDLDLWFDGRDVADLPRSPGVPCEVAAPAALEVEFAAGAEDEARAELARLGLVVDAEIAPVLDDAGAPSGPRPVPAPPIAGRPVRVVSASGGPIAREARAALELARPWVRRVTALGGPPSSAVAPEPERDESWVRCVLFADSHEHVAPLVGILRRELGYQTVDRLADLRGLRDLGRSLAWLVVLLVGGCLVVAAVSVLGTNAQKIQARVFEIGLLRANAVPLRRVLAIHLEQGLVLGALAFAAAALAHACAVPAAEAWSSRAFGVGALEGEAGLALGASWLTALVAALCLAGSVAGTTLPAWWACARLSPLEALRRRL